ncbi:MAG: hypothetical protein LBN26_03155 [Christensenellaceae bacterium]|jgi:hypothetical protein|nr:hypothetical protein [Christensenellaceae bacterium]
MMKKTKRTGTLILALITVFLLTGCGGGRDVNVDIGAFDKPATGVADESLAGVWRQENHSALINARKDAWEVYLTGDGLMYVLRSSDATDIGYHTDVLECEYRVENGSLRWAITDDSGYSSADVSDIQPEKDKLILYKAPGGEKITLIKTAAEVPFGYTRAGREQAYADERAEQEGILAFAAALSEKMNLPVVLNEDARFELDVPQGMQFSSGAVNFHITSGKNAVSQGVDEYYVEVPSGAMYFSAKCYLLGDYAVVFDSYDADFPPEWKQVLEADW